MKRLRVNYFVSGQEMRGRPLFKYLLLADDRPTDGKFEVKIVSLDPVSTPGGVESGVKTIVTENVDESLYGVQALLNSHHDSLKPIVGLIENQE